ncbi:MULTISPECIES: fimbrial protein [Photorhabdus]|uniref:Fimbrial protein n=1 Tax=Photorhabdus kayaii TaxID=230088 RepID=A0ABX0AXK3_9GAMM|nr:MULTISPECIES: fimbrial protein [Photorhabdus]MCC8373956.1 fimbrial protein [Photorhabdus bodei]MCC8466467.1 fimbrial protein [Photorhabdus bodei]MCT8353959.1 fimbrial protein [Photorhabdus kayaii]MDB6367389.1 fimbrial protein [Photorhabdus bodei]NDL10380.1 fimbrial protein [Photorhabdus kayaii]
MKAKLIISSLLVSSVLIPVANAADGKINFTGNIISNACKIDTDSANQNVNMGTISSTAFSGVDSTAAATPFSIKMSDCPPEHTHAQVKFDGQIDSKNNNLLALSNDKGQEVAGGVAVGIYEEDNSTLIPLAQASKLQAFTDQKTAELKFIAKYVATAQAISPGSGDAVANFTIVYN